MASAPLTAEAIDVEPADAEFTDAALDTLASLLVDDYFRQETAE